MPEQAQQVKPAWSPLSLGSFFRQQPSLQQRLDRLPRIELSAPRVLLYGPHHCGKTSLLFTLAFHVASKGGTVLFLCDQRSLDQSPPFLPQGVDANHPALSRIQFKYITDLQQLKCFGACLHLLADPPAVIIVGNLSQLGRNSTQFSDRRAQDVAITKALAFLTDGLQHLREQRSVDVLLLVSDTTNKEGVLSNMYLLQRWFPLMLSATQTGASARQQLTLQASQQGKQPLPAAVARAAVNYSLTQSYISVEAVADGVFG